MDMIPEVRTLLTLERDLNSDPDVCHGGIVVTIIDEIMGVVGTVFEKREIEIARACGEDLRQSPAMTAELVITYVRSVGTP